MTAPRGSSPYGPNTPAVRRFLQRLAGRPLSDCIAATRAYRALQGTPDFGAADRALGIAIDRGARTGARDAIVGPIVQLMASHTEGLARVPDAQVESEGLAEAALAAALALVARDVISAATFDLLYGPFARVIPMSEVDPA